MFTAWKMPLGWGCRSPVGGWPAYCGDVAGCPLTVLSDPIGLARLAVVSENEGKMILILGELSAIITCFGIGCGIATFIKR